MRALNTTGVLLLLSAFSLAFNDAQAGSRVQYFESLQSVEIEATTLQFNAFSRSFDIELQVNGRLSSSLSQAGLDGRIAAYQGRLVDNADSWVRIVIADGHPRGLIWNGSEMYAIEAPSNTNGAAVIFRVADLAIEPGTMQCGDVGDVGNGAELLKSVVSEISNAVQRGPGATAQIDVGVVADFEFTLLKGASVNTEILVRMNNVDGIFSEQLGVQLTVAIIETFVDANDPFSDEQEASLLLGELSDYRRGTPAQNSNGLTHLFTGRDLNGSTVGVAYSGALCSTGFSAGLTQGSNNETLDSLIAAHEIGHNFGAPHDGTPGSACESVSQDFLMAPSLNGSDTFSACSIEQMQDDVARAPCITPLPVSEVAVIAGTAQPALLGNPVSASFDISSTGANAANNVSVNVSVPNNVSLQSATTSLGTCTNGAGNVICTIGNIAGGSSANLTLSATAIGVGDAVFTATATADVDTNNNNNQATLQIPVDPAVDLSVSATAVSTLTLNQSTSLTLSLENGATIQATDVALSLNFTGGVNIDSADWPQGTCTIDVTGVACSANVLAAQANSAITINMTGVSVGTHSYTATTTADEIDIDTADNSVNGSVTVTAVGGGPPPENDDGGSGAVSIVMMIFLMGAGLARHRRPSGPVKR